MTSPDIPPQAITAAQAYDLAHRPRRRNWGRVPDDQVERLLKGAWRHITGLPADDPGRPVFVVAVGYDLGPDDAERIQHAVYHALRQEGGGT